MVLHNNPTALIAQGNTLADPKFKDGDTLKTFDYVVANPPFSDKRWSTGLDPLHDPYERFKQFGTPPVPVFPLRRKSLLSTHHSLKTWNLGQQPMHTHSGSDAHRVWHKRSYECPMIHGLGAEHRLGSREIDDDRARTAGPFLASARGQI